MKPTINKLIIVLLTYLLCSGSLWAQDEVTEKDNSLVAPRLTVQLGAQVGVPHNSFREHLDNQAGVGGGATLVWTPLAKAPFLGVGASISYLHFGRDLNTIYENSMDELRLKTSYSAIPIHGIVRISPWAHSRVSLYFDAMVGTTIFETRTKENDSFLVTLFEGESENPAFDRFEDSAFSYGGAAGVLIRLGQQTSLGLKMVTLKGDKAEYGTKGSTHNMADYLEYDLKESHTDLFLFQVDIVVRL